MSNALIHSYGNRFFSHTVTLHFLSSYISYFKQKLNYISAWIWRTGNLCSTHRRELPSWHRWSLHLIGGAKTPLLSVRWSKRQMQVSAKINILSLLTPNPIYMQAQSNPPTLIFTLHSLLGFEGDQNLPTLDLFPAILCKEI